MRGAAFRRLANDSHVLLAVALVVPILLIEVSAPTGRMAELLVLSAWFLAVQIVVGRVRLPSVRRDLVAFARFVIALVYVALCAVLGPDRVPAATVLFIPVIAMAAAFGGRQALVVGAVAITMYMLPLVRDVGGDLFVRERGIALAATAVVVAVGTRRTVADLGRAVVRLRAAVASERRRAQQLASLEEVGRLLAQVGPSDDSLEVVMGLLEQLGYRYVSIYLGDEKVMHLGAQHGYPFQIAEIDASTGVVGRVMRTRQAAFVKDVRSDPDYLCADDAISSEISAPLIADGQIFGVVNVEAAGEEPLDESDLAVMLLVADRLAAALTLARERASLARRAARFEGLTSFANKMAATLAPGELYPLIARSIGESIPCDAATLTALDADSGEYRIVASAGWEGPIEGSRILPGEGLTGRAIAERRIVVDEHRERSRWPVVLQGAPVPDVIRVAAAPLIRDDQVIGALSLTRPIEAEPFDALELEVLPLVASQAALAISNAQLHAAAMDASMRDPLTGMFNRRHLDASLARVFARRDRQPLDELRPLSVILFDLDHFGSFNKRHGHQLGDEVLRRFSAILRERFRASDIVARYGGEEFLVVLDGASRDEAVRAADAVRRAFRRLRFDGADGEKLTATVSAGCAGVEDSAGSAEGLLQLADVGLAMAKMGGRDRVVAA